MDKCEMCGTEIHSITTRRVVDHLFCTQCGDDIILPVVNACANIHCLTLVRLYQESGYTLTRQHAEEMAEELNVTS